MLAVTLALNLARNNALANARATASVISVNTLPFSPVLIGVKRINDRQNLKNHNTPN